MPSLFDPIQLGAITAPNRILMAPLTRGRATRDAVPTDIMVDYYTQRAGAGLIISEATGMSREGLGWPYAPGLWTDEQAAAWKPVTDSVHAAGGRIVAQLWHMGRQVHSSVIGGQPVSSSATRTAGQAHTFEGKQDFEVARPLHLDEMPRLLDDYERATRNAKAAGFDGVQIHAANGYLIDQFLRDGANHRDDEYGGSPEHRIRLLREVTERVASVIGADRTSVRLSPNGDSQGVNDSTPLKVFLPAAKALSEIGIAFLELREPGPGGTFGKTDVPRLSPAIRQVFDGPLVLNSDYLKADAQIVIDSGIADAIAFGRTFIANPDLPERLRRDAPLNQDDAKTWYSQGPEGYVDYPARWRRPRLERYIPPPPPPGWGRNYVSLQRRDPRIDRGLLLLVERCGQNPQSDQRAEPAPDRQHDRNQRHHDDRGPQHDRPCRDRSSLDRRGGYWRRATLQHRSEARDRRGGCLRIDHFQPPVTLDHAIARRGDIGRAAIVRPLLSRAFREDQRDHPSFSLNESIASAASAAPPPLSSWSGSARATA